MIRMSAVSKQGVLAAGLVLLFSPVIHAADPASGSLSLEAPQLVFTTGPSAISNPSGTAQLICANPVAPCDDFALTVRLPDDVLSLYPGAAIRISTAWAETSDDYDSYLLDAGGEQVNSAASSVNPEVMNQPAAGGETQYTVRLVPFLATGSIATTTIDLVLGDPGSGGGGGGTAGGDGSLPFDPQAPRYSVYVSPPGEGNDSGEPTVGYNPMTLRAMFISYVNALRITFPENLESSLPQSCDALWENKSGLITTLNSLDPIMTTDQVTGRTFNSQLSGANSLFEFSDDDGESWTIGQIGPPNGGADHQGLVAGPYPADFALPTAGLLYPNAVYYCSQSIAAAFCARSDDGAQTFGPGIPFKNLDCGAGGLHGHPKVAPDGTLYVPDSSQCVAPLGESAEKVIAFVSEDAGTTFQVRPIPQSSGGAGSDPSIALATDGTAYMCYENADGTTHVAMSRDKGLTWENDTDIGLAAGLVQTRFPAMIAGDPDRAACAFLGTPTEGDGNALGFKGVWYPYIATTYDAGKTWTLVNVSPGDPVQGHGGVGPSGTNRNLLDFNDLELDERGRPLFAYADGCIGGCVQDPSQNSFAAKGTLARQSGGRSLLAAFDSADDLRYSSSVIVPAPACPLARLSERTQLRTLVAWVAPDNGGAEVSNYQVLRASDPAGPFTKVGDMGTKTQFLDASADPNVEKYYYQIIADNSKGASAVSNVLELAISDVALVDTCTLPGDPIITDPAADSPLADYDILSLAVAEPAEYEGNFVVTLKLAGFTAGEPPPTSFYPILFPLRDSFYLAFDVSQVLPRFVYGTFSELPQGLLAFTEVGELDERSTYAADGTVVFVVPKALFGDPQPGAIIAGWDVRSRAGSATATSRDSAGPADYQVRGSALCGLTGTVLATLGADRNAGAVPLTVKFTVGGSAADDATLRSFDLDFGDGQTMPNQAFGTQNSIVVPHVYQQPGTYRALLTVKDSSGNVSGNLAEQTIVVGEPGSGGGRDAGRFGSGALDLSLLLMLLLPGLRYLRLRRR